MAQPSRPKGDVRFALAAAATALGFLGLPFLIASAPIEPVMGPIQKIFYFHVPCCWMLLLSTLTVMSSESWKLSSADF